MDADSKSDIPQLMALGAVIAAACLSGIAAVASWVVLAMDHSMAAPAPAASRACNVCGVVEEVREIQPLLYVPAGAAPGGLAAIGVGPHGGGSVEGIVNLLAALAGASPGAAGRPAKVYEVTLRLNDGTVRALRDITVPDWKAGDRVKVVKGRIEAIL